MTNRSIIHTNLYNPNNKLINASLEHFWCMDKSWAYMDSQNSPQPELEGSHHLPPYIILCVWSQRLHPNIIFLKTPKSRVSKFPKLGFPPLWMPITSCANLQLRWGLKKSYNLHQYFSNYMWHASFTHVIQGDSWLLMVKSQIDILIPNLLLTITCVLSTQMDCACPF